MPDPDKQILDDDVIGTPNQKPGRKRPPCRWPVKCEKAFLGYVGQSAVQRLVAIGRGIGPNPTMTGEQMDPQNIGKRGRSDGLTRQIDLIKHIGICRYVLIRDDPDIPVRVRLMPSFYACSNNGRSSIDPLKPTDPQDPRKTIHLFQFSLRDLAGKYTL